MRKYVDAQSNALIRVDKSAESIGVTLQFNVFSAASLDWLFRIRFEKAVRITCVSIANLTSTKTQVVNIFIQNSLKLEICNLHSCQNTNTRG